VETGHGGSNNIDNKQDPDEDMKQTEKWIRIRIKIKRGTDRIPQHYMLCTAYIQKKVFAKLEFITKVFRAIVSVIMYGTLL
jgi:hypothetical protein